MFELFFNFLKKSECVKPDLFGNAQKKLEVLKIKNYVDLYLHFFLKLKHKKSRYKLYRLLKYIRNVNDYLPSSIFFFNAARPLISPNVVFSASAAFLTATLTFLFSCSLNKDV